MTEAGLQDRVGLIERIRCTAVSLLPCQHSEPCLEHPCGVELSGQGFVRRVRAHLRKLRELCELPLALGSVSRTHHSARLRCVNTGLVISSGVTLWVGESHAATSLPARKCGSRCLFHISTGIPRCRHTRITQAVTAWLFHRAMMTNRSTSPGFNAVTRRRSSPFPPCRSPWYSRTRHPGRLCTWDLPCGGDGDLVPEINACRLEEGLSEIAFSPSLQAVAEAHVAGPAAPSQPAQAVR